MEYLKRLYRVTFRPHRRAFLKRYHTHEFQMAAMILTDRELNPPARALIPITKPFGFDPIVPPMTGILVNYDGHTIRVLAKDHIIIDGKRIDGWGRNRLESWQKKTGIIAGRRLTRPVCGMPWIS